jgi:hypothetical protein
MGRPVPSAAQLRRLNAVEDLRMKRVLRWQALVRLAYDVLALGALTIAVFEIARGELPTAALASAPSVIDRVARRAGEPRGTAEAFRQDGGR